MTFPFLQEILSAFPGAPDAFDPQSLSVSADGNLASYFDVTGLATSSIGAAGLMLAQYARGGANGGVKVKTDSRLASLWFGMSLRPEGWEMPPIWDPIAGDYRAKNGWIRLHTNAPHHRAAALSVLGEHSNREALEPVITGWDAVDLENAVVGAGGCAAAMKSLESWIDHPQGLAVSQQPLILWQAHEGVDPKIRQLDHRRPLAGIKVLDLTRVLAGPVAGRFLAAYGADLLRIDPADWDEPAVIPEVTLGKRCAGLDLKDRDDRVIFEDLLAEADVLLHGYRPDALINLGYDSEGLRTINPCLIDVTLNAYGWSGPWSKRRGFDSLVQMSCGIADYGMRMSGADKPVPLPVQALDHATGYLMAAAVLHALLEQARSGKVLSARLSLARTACLLCATKRPEMNGKLVAERKDDIDPHVENTAWGPGHRVKFPIEIAGIKHSWDYPAAKLRSAPAVW